LLLFDLENYIYGMKMIVSIIVLVLVSSAFANECKVFAVGKVICKDSDYGITSIYKKKKGKNWIAKIYAEERKDVQTEAVMVRKYFDVDLFDACLEGFQKYLEEESKEMAAVDMALLCNKEIDKIHEALKTGETLKLFFFDRALRESEPISIMYCTRPTYVRTFAYNKDTGLETDRRDYHDLRPGTYCKDFLATDDLYWKKSLK
jgi:hypothetical protein